MKTKNLLILPLTILTGLTSIVSKPVSFNNFTSVNKMINPLKASVDIVDLSLKKGELRQFGNYLTSDNFSFAGISDTSSLMEYLGLDEIIADNTGVSIFHLVSNNLDNPFGFSVSFKGSSIKLQNNEPNSLFPTIQSYNDVIDYIKFYSGTNYSNSDYDINLKANEQLTWDNYFSKITDLDANDGCLFGESTINDIYIVLNDVVSLDFYISDSNNADVLGKNVFISQMMDSGRTYPNMIVNGGSKTITINYASNYTQEEIVAMVKVKDLFGIDVPISVKSSDYVPNKVGNYTIVLQATDSYNQTATATLKVVAIDKNPPVVLKRKDLDVQYGQMVSNEQIFACFDVSDESGVEPTLEITNNGGFDFTNVAPNEVKSYTITITATDQSGNTATGTMTLNIIDTTPPSISKKEGSNTDIVKYGYSESYQLNKSTLLGLYTANDEVDGKVDLYIKSGEVDSSIGEHQITLAAKDKSNNETTLIVKYQILADIPPVFILDSKLVNTSTDSPLTKQQIEQVAKAIAPEGASLVTLTNEEEISTYQTNYDKVGSKYRISYAYKINEETKQDYFMLQPSEDYVKEEKKSGWENFVEGWNNFFSNVSKFFQKLKNWFRGIFTHFEWNDFITDEEYNIKHNK